MKHVGMSRSATPATRNEATQRWKAPKVTPFAELPIGTAIRPSREQLRTVANGCERLRTVADGCERLGNVWRTQLNPQTPRVKWEPLLRIRENQEAGLREPPLFMTDCWANVMGQGTEHSFHQHNRSTISGTYYVQTPRKCSSLLFEDPRLDRSGQGGGAGDLEKLRSNPV